MYIYVNAFLVMKQHPSSWPILIYPLIAKRNASIDSFVLSVRLGVVPVEIHVITDNFNWDYKELYIPFELGIKVGV
jgi:hypothetical protein